MNSVANTASSSPIKDDRDGAEVVDMSHAAEPSGKSLDVSIIVVSYNTREMTLACLRSIVAETTHVEYEVLFIDNCSTDGSFEAVRDEFGDDTRFHIVLADENLGFAGGNNVLAESAKGRFILLLNPDTIVLNGAIERLLDFATEHPSNRIWGGRTIFGDGSLNPGNCWAPFTVWSEFCAAVGLRAAFPNSKVFHPRAYGTWQRDSVREVGVVTGCFFLMKVDDWRLLGGFDPEFFMYGEETDLCMRGIKQGMRPIVTPDAEIIHYGGASESIQVEKYVRLFDAQVRLFRRHFSRPVFGSMFFLMKIGVFGRAILTKNVDRIQGRKVENLWQELWQRRVEWTKGASGPVG
ncbi:MAG: glycosyltransferase family 2 protein [Phycisphaerales bacterium]